MTIKMYCDGHWMIPLNFLSPLWQNHNATILQMKTLELEDRSMQLAQGQGMEWSDGGIPGPKAWDPCIQQPLPSHSSPDLSSSTFQTLPPLRVLPERKFNMIKDKTDFLPNEISTHPLHLSLSLIMMTSMFFVIIQIWTLYFSSHPLRSTPIQSPYNQQRIRSSRPFSQPFPPPSLSLHHHLLP